ncbi:MAG: hypothetical protein KIS75_12370 [Chromatiales bacterium]|nr:hypothetical protein [Chromatiales bacterium]
MALSEPSAKVTEFIGLNNRAEPRAMTPGELVQADNVDIDDRKKLRRRRGFAESLVLADLSSAWATPDESRLFAVAGGALYELRGSTLDPIELATGLDDGETYWDWDGERIFVSNANGDLIIDGETAYGLAIPRPAPPVVTPVTGDLPAGRYLAAVVLEDAQGRQGGASDFVVTTVEEGAGLQIAAQLVPAGYTARLFLSRANDTVLRQAAQQVTSLEQLGAALEEQQLAGFAPVAGGPIAWHAGRLAKKIDHENHCLVVFSCPYWPHLFEYGPLDFAVPGHIRVLEDVQSQALLVGTDLAIWRHHLDEGLQQVADYGVPAGMPAAKNRDGMVYLMTNRGLCRALPFENLTDMVVSIDPGTRAAVGIVEHAGFTRALALTSGSSTPDNAPR